VVRKCAVGITLRVWTLHDGVLVDIPITLLLLSKDSAACHRESALFTGKAWCLTINVSLEIMADSCVYRCASQYFSDALSG
jgi:hypothetical protein